MNFEDLGIHRNLLRAIKDMKYEKPSEIQVKSIPEALLGKDIVGLAQTGTGKTAAFAIPTIQNINNIRNKNKNYIHALVLVPTRELAQQVYESFENYGKYTSLKSAVIYGGVGQGNQVRKLRNGIDILIATPGRLLDLMEQKHIDIAHVSFFILDEADRMLDMGFIHDIKRVIKQLPKKKQTLLFSATMPTEVEGIVETLLKDPVKVSVSPRSSTVDKIDQKLYFIDKQNKTKLLLELLKKEPYRSFLIFTRTKRNADKLNKSLLKAKIKSSSIHGDKSQNARQRALKDFKDYKLQVLVATDIAARGIDVDELDYVINYDLPDEAETYVHRIGRTGRAGMNGVAISFCSHSEKQQLKEIEKLIKIRIPVIKEHPYPLKDFSNGPKKYSKQNKKMKHKSTKNRDIYKSKNNKNKSK